MSGFHGAFATGVASQQGTLTLPDTWFRPPFWDLLMLQLLRPNSSNLPCLYSTFHLEYPLVLSRFCFATNVACVHFSWFTILTSRVFICDNHHPVIRLSMCVSVRLCGCHNCKQSKGRDHFVCHSVCSALFLLALTAFRGALVGINTFKVAVTSYYQR